MVSLVLHQGTLAVLGERGGRPDLFRWRARRSATALSFAGPRVPARFDACDLRHGTGSLLLCNGLGGATGRHLRFHLWRGIDGTSTVPRVTRSAILCPPTSLTVEV